MVYGGRNRHSPLCSSASSFPKLWFEASLYKLLSQVVAFHYYCFFMHHQHHWLICALLDLAIFLLACFCDLLVSPSGFKYMLLGWWLCILDDGGCSGDANTTKEEEEIAVSDHFPHSRHRVRMNLHLFISFCLSICTQSVLQLSVSCCYAAAALRGNTQNSNSLKTLFELLSSWCVCRAWLPDTRSCKQRWQMEEELLLQLLEQALSRKQTAKRCSRLVVARRECLMSVMSHKFSLLQDT